MNRFLMKTQYVLALLGALSLAACAAPGPQGGREDESGGTAAADAYYDSEATGDVLAGKELLPHRLGGVHPTDSHGPVPDPWKPAGPVPDPWNGGSSGGSSGANPPPNPNPNPNPSPNPDPDKDKDD